MVEMKVVRKITIHGPDNITIKSDILEEKVTDDEYRDIYSTRTNELAKLKEVMTQAKAELKEILAIEEISFKKGETSELKKFTEMLIKADKLKKKETTIKNLKKMEIEAKQEEEELEMFTPAMKKLNVRD